MTGSPLVPIVVPLVALICLAVWFAIVFYADAHPVWKHPSLVESTESTEIAAAPPASQDATEPAPPVRRAA